MGGVHHEDERHGGQLAGVDPGGFALGQRQEVVAYLGMGLPSVLFGIALRYFAVQNAMIGFATVLSCGAVVSVVVALRDRAPGPGELPARSAHPC
ncbi:hypothetical protein ACFW2I_21605 [Streptomyces nigra]|uniref:hypothetical protein n=1 Tax=Streptomyces nigra TaxID=1827580 RepID=UPI003695D557